MTYKKDVRCPRCQKKLAESKTEDTIIEVYCRNSRCRHVLRHEKGITKILN